MAFLSLPVMLGISAALGVGSTVAEMVTKPSAPKAPTDTTQQQADAAQAAAQAQALALEKRRGMASTMLTSPLGVSSGTATQKATLG